MAGDPLDAALAFLADRVPVGAVAPVVDERPPASGAGVDFAAARARVRPSTRNGVAQLAAIDAVEAATTHPIGEGLALERAAFVRLVDSPEAKALRHVFFAEKEAAKVADIDRATAPRPVERVAVIGAGTMGTGIAMAFANGGVAVDLIEQNTEALERGVATIRRTYEATAAKGRLSAGQVEQRIAAIVPSLDLGTASAAISSSKRSSRTWRSRRRCSPNSTPSPSRVRCWRRTPPAWISTRSPDRYRGPAM